jgi:hypothetical protein
MKSGTGLGIDKVLFLTFGIASLIAIATGAWCMAQSGLPAGLWLRNPIAWLITAIPAIVWRPFRVFPSWSLLLAIVLLGACFIGAGQSGVHRWLGLGPVQLNAAALILPLVIATVQRPARVVDFVGLGVLAAILAIQPDRSQLIAFGIACVVISFERLGLKGLIWGLILVAASVAVCLTRSDPLQPVAHVEGIVAMAWAQARIVAIIMVVAILASAFSPLLLITRPHLRMAAIALSAYYLVSLLASFSGAYPVPLAGYGLSYVIGWWLGVAALIAVDRQEEVPVQK